MSAGISKWLDFHGRESSKILSPISGSNYPVSEEYPLTAANFPGLLEAFTADGISGNNLVGRLGTVTITSSTGWTQPAAGQFRAASSAAFTTSGAWEAIGTRNATLILVGSIDSNSFSTMLGNASAGSSIGGSPSGSSLTITPGSAFGLTFGDFTGVSYPIDAFLITAEQISANGSVLVLGVDGATNLGPTGNFTNGDISTTIPAFNIGVSCASISSRAASYYTGIFLLATANPLSNSFLWDAMRWMAAHPKQLYPGFYHLV